MRGDMKKLVSCLQNLSGFKNLTGYTLLLLITILPACHAEPETVAVANPQAAEVVAGAAAQIGKTLFYDGSYRKLDYPGGDVPLLTGVCTDVVVRAFRHAGVDLQVEVHKDMRRAFKKYPRLWGLKGTDRNIDHRRVPNLRAFFKRRGKSLPVTKNPADYQPGDVVSWRLDNGLPHIGIVSDRRGGERPWVIHNIGLGAQLEDMLFEYEITGHYRFF